MMTLARRTAVLLPFLALFSAPAAAAPQAIALIASAEPMELRCHLGHCGVEVTGFCLERKRESPIAGTGYFLHDPAGVTLTGQRADGTALALGPEHLTITSERGHTAIWLSVPASLLRDHELASVSVSVGRDVTLLPEPVAGDPAPHTAAEIALITGPMRATGSKVMAQSGERVAAAQLTSLVLNQLPRWGRASEAERAAHWQAAAPSTQAPGYAAMKDGYETCYARTASGRMSLRQCLGSLHDSFMGKLNVKYWKALEVGS